MLKLGSKETLQDHHIPELSENCCANTIVENLARNWNNIPAGDNRLLKALWATVASEYWWLGFIQIVAIPFKIFLANVLGYLVDFLLGASSSDVSIYNNGYILSAMLVMCSTMFTFCQHHYSFFAYSMGMKLRIALSGIIYRKAISLHLRSLSKTATGKIISLASQDIEILQLAGVFLHYMYTPIIEAFVVLYFGYIEVGASFLVGFASILLLIPLQSFFSRLIGKNRKVTASYSDERIKLVNQALMGARVMKMNGWEWGFKSLIQQTREKEVGSLMRTNYLKAFNEVRRGDFITAIGTLA